MGQMIIGHNLIVTAHVLHRFAHVGGIPIHDRADDEVKARCAILLSLMATIDDSALAECVDCLGQRMALLAVVEARVAATAQLGAFQPVQHEQSPLDFANFLESHIELVLSFIGGQLAQHDRWSHVAGFDRTDQSQHVRPLLANDIDPQLFAQQRRNEGIAGSRVYRGEAPIGKITKPRAKAKTQHRAKCKHVIGRAAGVGIMLSDSEGSVAKIGGSQR